MNDATDTDVASARQRENRRISLAILSASVLASAAAFVAVAQVPVVILLVGGIAAIVASGQVATPPDRRWRATSEPAPPERK
ncbi:MAG: hypothetical protein HYX29_11785 [Solirubrobacterales bacterium]|nr:hypothetical protein [Solirubrobacterales bacterium]